MYEVQRGRHRDVHELQRCGKEVYDQVCPQLRFRLVIVYRDDDVQAVRRHRLIPLYAVRRNRRTIEEKYADAFKPLFSKHWTEVFSVLSKT